MIRRPPRSTLFPLHDALPISSKPHDTFVSTVPVDEREGDLLGSYRLVTPLGDGGMGRVWLAEQDRKSTRLNPSHSQISYAVFCLKKKKANKWRRRHELYRRSY